MTDLTDRFLAARLTPVRDALWRNGEITISGLRRLDEALGIDTYTAINQCDGCRRGLPVNEFGHHGGYIACTADRYGTQAPSDTD